MSADGVGLETLRLLNGEIDDPERPLPDRGQVAEDFLDEPCHREDGVMKKMVIGITPPRKPSAPAPVRWLARGDHRLCRNAPGVWFTSMRSLVEVLSADITRSGKRGRRGRRPRQVSS